MRRAWPLGTDKESDQDVALRANLIMFLALSSHSNDSATREVLGTILVLMEDNLVADIAAFLSGRSKIMEAFANGRRY